MSILSTRTTEVNEERLGILGSRGESIPTSFCQFGRMGNHEIKKTRTGLANPGGFLLEIQ